MEAFLWNCSNFHLDGLLGLYNAAFYNTQLKNKGGMNKIFAVIGLWSIGKRVADAVNLQDDMKSCRGLRYHYDCAIQNAVRKSMISMRPTAEKQKWNEAASIP